MKNGRLVFAVTLLLALAVPLWAEAAPASTPFGYQSSVVMQINDAENKLVQLAEAMPQEKFDWRPAEGVRSFGEVLLHVASGNYLFGKMMGTALPEGVDPAAMEKGSLEKAKVIAQMKSSFEFARGVVNGVPNENLGAAMKIFGRDGTKGAMLMIYATHAHEHLGQEIAYARMSGVTPPWSMKQ